MAPFGKLYGVDFRPVKVIKTVAALAGLEIEMPEYKHYDDNLKPEFKEKFPHSKIPAFESADGSFRLFEGTAIAKYLALQKESLGLLGSNPKDAALIEQWTHFIDTEVFVNGLMVILQIRNVLPYHKGNHAELLGKVDRGMNTLEAHLASRTFLVTERITLADLWVASCTQTFSEHLFGKAEREKYPNTLRHMSTVVFNSKVSPYFGEPKFIETAPVYTPPAKEPKAAPAPKAPKAAKKKEVEEDEEDEDLAPAEPKKKNPLDDLPKSSFNLEDWKRAYSNLDTRGPGGAIEWFYEKFDHEGFSIWRTDFKYNEELTLTFMSANQITGFFNRLEASRKYLFGSVGVLGKANDSIISGVFILRGQDCQPVVEVAPDYESYEYKKIDLSNEEDKKFFEAALAWDLEIDGKPWADGKNFK